MESGIHSLANRELLALIIRSGNKNNNVLEIADRILVLYDGLNNFVKMEMEDLVSIKGIKENKALELMACVELSKRLAYQKFKNSEIGSFKNQIDWLQQVLGSEKNEHFLALFLDTKNRMMSYETIFVGTLDKSIVHPREIFKEAVRRSASKIVIAHNHPSNDCTPSLSDIQTTDRMREAGEVMGIPVVDHIIVGHGSYFSFSEAGLIGSK